MIRALFVTVALFPVFAFAQSCDPGGPLTVAQLELLGVTPSSVSSLVLRAFGVVLGFWSMGYIFGLLTKAISRS